ncbi:hypothetical protein [Streptomyces sp.]
MSTAAPPATPGLAEGEAGARASHDHGQAIANCSVPSPSVRHAPAKPGRTLSLAVVGATTSNHSRTG